MHIRLFKAKAFAVAAQKAAITDVELCRAIQDVMKGLGDELGGDVWKKRLNKNRHRSIVLAKGRDYWIYQFLFAKNDQANITHKELAAFEDLAKAYEALSKKQIKLLLDRKDFLEICHGEKIQK